MRVSTQTFYEHSRNAMGSLQDKLMRVQQQLGAGTRVLAPSDDPLVATRALAVSQSLALSAQYAASRSQAVQTLALEENALQGVTQVLQNAKGLLIQAGNGTLTDADRRSIAATLESSRDQLQGLANADDGNGQFLFAGFKSASPPFVKQAGGAMAYVGDQGARSMQVDVSRQMATADTGAEVFMAVQGSAGYVTAGAAGNTGAALFGPVSVLNAADPLQGQGFVLSFGAGGSYQVDTAGTPSQPVLPATPYVAGQPLQFGGLQITLSGTPAAGDRFTLAPARNAGTDVFAALQDLIGALQAPVDNAGAAGAARLANALSTANLKLTHAHENVLTVRASVGSRLQELEALGRTGDDRTLQDKLQLSSLVDLDYGAAISEFHQRQTALQASQQTYVQLQKIALFNYL